MDKAKRERLEASGWRVGTVSELLELTPAEEHLIEMRLALSRLVRDMRVTSEITQDQLATWIGSSQSRAAKMEAGDPGVSSDLMFKAAVCLGASPVTIGDWLSETWNRFELTDNKGQEQRRKAQLVVYSGVRSQ